MAIQLAKDAWKLPISRKMGISLMLFTGIVLLFFIISTIIWMNDYDAQAIMDQLKASGKLHTQEAAAAYIRFKAIVSIVGNTLVMGFFSGLVWWGTRNKRYGFVYGVFWLVIFGANAIGLPFYAIKADAFAIVSSLLNGVLAVIMLIWIVQLMQFRGRMRQQIARKHK